MKNNVMSAPLILMFLIGIIGAGLTVRPAFAQPEPYLEVRPNSVFTNKLEVFDVSVWLDDITADKRLIGVQFTLRFNMTLLQATGATEGPFMMQFNQSSTPPFTVFVSDFSVPGEVEVAVLLLPNPDPLEPPYTVFPVGSGEIAKITLEGIFTPPEMYVPHGCALELADIILIDDESNEILYLPPINGYYEITLTLLGDINRDGQVDIRDIAMAAYAFGSYPGHRRWLPYGPIADVNNDNRVDIRDMTIIAKNFGQHV